MSNAKFTAAIAAINEQREKHGLNLGGKLYSMVKDRVEVFRREWGDEYGIDTVVDYSQGFGDGSAIVAIAKIYKGEAVMATGHAMVFVGSDAFTANSPIEVAETSAIGRALACFGLHGGEYASSNEVETKRPVDRDSREQQNRAPQTPIPGYNQQMGTAQPLNQQRSGPPAPQPSGLYVPDDVDRGTPDEEQNRVLHVIDSIDNIPMLGRYWNELKPFMNFLKQEDPDMMAEVKAAFATANSLLGGK